MSEQSDVRVSDPVNLVIEVTIPDDRRVSKTVPISTTVEEFITQVMEQAGADTPSRHDLEVPLSRQADQPKWYPVNDHEPILDALRGVQYAPRIVPTNEPGQNPGDTPQ